MHRTLAISGLGVLILFAGAWYAFSRSGEPASQNAQAPSATIEEQKPMELTSSAFENNGEIPSKYTCEGENISPPLSFSAVPEGAQSLALTMHDIDISKAVKKDGTFDHWVVFNIIPTATEVAEGEVPGIEGKHGAGRVGYLGSCPPKAPEPSRHRYVFTLYALNSELALAEGATRQELLDEMEGKILETAELIGTYEKKN